MILEFEWKKIITAALICLEQELRKHPEKFEDTLRGEKSGDIDKAIIKTLYELDDYWFVIGWAHFEGFLNDWFLRRLVFVTSNAEEEKKVAEKIRDRILRWSMSEKIDALRPILGNKYVDDLHSIRKLRNWIVHHRQEPRPDSTPVTIAEELLKEVMEMLDSMCDGNFVTLKDLPK